MATTPNRNFTAGADLSANKERFVKFDGSGNLVAADAASTPIGIQTDKPLSGGTVGLQEIGETGRLKLGGTVTRSQWVKPDANAAGVAATGDGDIAGAFALQSGVDGDIINVDVISPITLSFPA